MNHTLKADCTNCTALCCTALAFQRSPDFGHDKPVGTPCQFLNPNCTCQIHPKREQLGYEGCMDFDCRGAGQRATKAFAGANWQTDPETRQHLFRTFRHLLDLQEMRAVLAEAETLPLDDAAERHRYLLLDQIAALADDGIPEERDIARAMMEARRFVETLR